MIRVLVAGDGPARRGALAAALARDGDLELAGETSAGERAAAIAATEPDVLLADAREIGHLEATDPPAVLIGDEAPFPGAGAGPHGLLARDASADDIVAAIRAVAAGLIVRQPATRGGPPLARAPRNSRDPGTHPQVGDRLPIPGPRPQVGPAIASLSVRERDVLEHLASGASNKAIADVLGITDHTVKTHIAAIFAKLGVSSRTEAVAQGVRLGIVML